MGEKLVPQQIQPQPNEKAVPAETITPPSNPTEAGEPTMAPTPEVKQQVPLDPSELTIDEEASLAFKKEGKYAVPNFRIAYDAKGNKVLVILPIHFVRQQTREIRTPEEVNGIHPELIDLYQYRFKQTEGAWILSDELGVPMAETRAAELNNLPVITFRYIEGVEDRGYGANVQFSEDPSVREKQEADFAKGAIMQAILLSDPRSDNGQYLQGPDGQIYLSDILIEEGRPGETINTQRLFDKVALQGEERHGGYFTRAEPALRHQINGLTTPEAQALLTELNKLDEERLAELLPEVKEEDRAQLLQRARSAVPIFRTLAMNPEDTQKMLNPVTGRNQRKYSPEVQQEATAKLREIIELLAD